MGIIMGALAGAGDYIAKSELQNQQRMDTMELENHRSDLEMRKAKMVDDLREQSAIKTERRAEEPLKRFGAALSANQQGDVPVTAAPVTSLAGKQGQNSAGEALTTGFTGDIAKVKADIMALPEGVDKTQALQQLKSQFAAETETAQKGIIGQTRKMTNDEALSKTMTDTLATDPVALTAYEKNIGESRRKDRRIDVTEDRADARSLAAAEDSKRKATTAEQSDATQRYLGELRSQTTLDAILQKNGGGGNIAHEERLRYTSLFQEAGRRVAEAQKTLSTLTTGSNSLLFNMAVKRDPNGPESQQLDELRSNIKTHNEERTLFQGFLSGSQGAEKPAPSLGGVSQAESVKLPSPASGPAMPTTRAEMDALPSGAKFINPADGKTYQKK